VTLFRQPGAPTPPTFSEQLRRANAALPDRVRVAFKPFQAKGLRNPRPYRVLEHRRDVGGAASLEGALFIAARRAKGIH